MATTTDIEGLNLEPPSVVYLDGQDLSDTVITIDDVMRAGHCVRGTKRWFGEHQLDFAKFLAEGIPAYDFLATMDGHAIQVARVRLRRDNG